MLMFATADVSSSVIAAPSGWTERAAGTLTLDGQYYMICDRVAASEPASYTVTNNNGQVQYVMIGAWSGRDTAAPRTFLTATTSSASNPSPITLAADGGTAVDGDDIAYFTGLDKNGADPYSFTEPASYTERQDATATWNSVAFFTRDNVAAGATGTINATATRDSGTANAGWVTIVVAIAAGGAQPGANAPTTRSRGFNLQQMADAEDEGRFNELDVRNWF